MNQYYSAELSQKVLRGLRESYLKGQYTGGPQVYGYNVVNKKLVINPEEAEIVREIFFKFANGYTGKAIADNLVARGIRTKTGHYLDDKKLYKIIANPKYIGKATYGGVVYPNIYPAIIDEQTWQAVQDIRNLNKHTPGSKKQKFNFLLSGKLICGICRTYMIGESGKGKGGDIYKYYSCLSRRKKRKPCNSESVRKDWLEDLVMLITWSLLEDNNTLETLINAIYKKHITENKEEALIKSLEKRRDEALKASSNLITAIEQGFLTEQTKFRLKELETQISQLDFDIEQAKQRNFSYLTPDKIREYFRKVVCGDIASEKTREYIIRFFIREVLLYNDKIVITYNFFENDTKKKTTPDDIDEIENELLTIDNPDYFHIPCLCKQVNSPPTKMGHIYVSFFIGGGGGRDHFYVSKNRFAVAKLYGILSNIPRPYCHQGRDAFCQIGSRFIIAG